MIETFGLSTEHQAMQQTLRRLVDREIRPLVQKAEKEKTFPRDVIPLLAKHELIGLKYPIDKGGQGLDIIAECLLVEELTRAAAGASAGIFAHIHLGIAPIIYFGSPQLQEEFAAPALRGELLAGFSLTEPGAGSDVKGIRTRAVRDGSDYVINGQKVFTTNGSIADYLIVAAYTDPGSGSKGISIFVVPTDTPGFEARPLGKLGNWSSDTAEVFLTDVRIPEAYRIGAEHGGFLQLMQTLTEGRIIVSTRGLALAEQAYELALKYAKEREAFGHVIGSYQAVSHKIARMAVDIDAARLMIYRAARLYMAGEECTIAASKAKYFATTVAQRVTTEALHVHGGWGYTSEFDIERLYRDAPESVIGEGTAEIQLRIIAKSLGMEAT
jgi:alkylation response protein AidB-like acyl-CoA dehydrogenase